MRERIAFAAGSFTNSSFTGSHCNLRPELDRDVRQVANRRYPVADLDREIGIFAATNTLEEIVMLARRVGVEVEFLRPDFGIEDLVGTGLDGPAPTDVTKPAFSAYEFDAGLPGLQVITTPFA